MVSVGLAYLAGSRLESSDSAPRCPAGYFWNRRMINASALALDRLRRFVGGVTSRGILRHTPGNTRPLTFFLTAKQSAGSDVSVTDRRVPAWQLICTFGETGAFMYEHFRCGLRRCWSGDRAGELA